MGRGAPSPSVRRALASPSDPRRAHDAASRSASLLAPATPPRCHGRAGVDPAPSRRACRARSRRPCHLVPPLAPRADLPAASAPADGERATVHLLPGCVMPELFGDTVRQHRRRARGQRLPRGRAGGAALLRRARAPRRRSRPRARRGAAHARCARRGDSRNGAAPPIVATAAGCGAHDEGVGRALRRRSRARADAARAVAQRVRDATELLGGARRPRASGRRTGPARRLSRSLSPRARAGGAERAARSARRDSGDHARADGGRGSLLRERRPLQRDATRDGACARGAEGGGDPRERRGPRRDRQRRLRSPARGRPPRRRARDPRPPRARSPGRGVRRPRPAPSSVRRGSFVPLVPPPSAPVVALPEILRGFRVGCSLPALAWQLLLAWEMAALAPHKRRSTAPRSAASARRT